MRLPKNHLSHNTKKNTTMLRRAIAAAPSARMGLRALAPRVAAVRSLHATGARFADDAAGGAGGLTLNFTMPTKSLYAETAVEMVILPGGDGMFGVMPSHVPTITELKPGVISVQETAGGPLSKYFVSGGFASGALLPPPAQVACCDVLELNDAARDARGGGGPL
jgi:hypothetical protein